MASESTASGSRKTCPKRSLKVRAKDAREVGALGVRHGAAGDGAGDLDVGQLVLADGHHVALAEEDVAGLVHRVGQQQAGERMARGLLLGLDGGVAVQLAFAHQAQEGQHQLVERRHGRMREDHGLGGVDASGHVVDDHVVDVVLDVGRGVAVCDDLVVGDDDVGLDAAVLQLDAALEGAEVMADVQAAGGAVAREHDVLAGVHVEVGADLVAALERGLKATFVCHGCLSFFGTAVTWYHCAPTAAP